MDGEKIKLEDYEIIIFSGFLSNIAPMCKRKNLIHIFYVAVYLTWNCRSTIYIYIYVVGMYIHERKCQNACLVLR